MDVQTIMTAAVACIYGLRGIFRCKINQSKNFSSIFMRMILYNYKAKMKT